MYTEEVYYLEKGDKIYFYSGKHKGNYGIALETQKWQNQKVKIKLNSGEEVKSDCWDLYVEDEE